jgi:glycosyltransferase involved in cell wall biosynthesis
MLCSIIIPLYNKADFIAEALQSVFNQTYQSFEVIIVDDGSKDDGVARVQLIKDDRITLVQQANGGVSSARNRGIEIAQGDVVCFLDADDWYLPQYLETIVTMAKNYPEIAFFATHYKMIDLGSNAEKNWKITDTNNVEVIDDFFYRWQCYHLVHTDSVAVRRVFLTPLQPCFPVGEQMGEDQDLFFRLAEKSSLAYCKESLTGYRIEVNDSLCAIYRGNVLFPAYLRLEQRALMRQIPDRLRYSALQLVADTRITAARTTLIIGHRYEAFKQLLIAWRGVVSRRWWVSVLMCIFATPAAVQHWDDWRNSKNTK